MTTQPLNRLFVSIVLAFTAVIGIVLAMNPSRIGLASSNVFSVSSLGPISDADPRSSTHANSSTWEASAIAVSGTLAYLGISNNLFVLDVSNPNVPILTGHLTLNIANSIGDIKIQDHYLYIAAGDDGLRIVSILSPTHPSEIGHTMGITQAVRVVVSGTYAYVAGWNLAVVSVANPAAPQILGIYPSEGGGSTAIDVQGSYVLGVMQNSLVILSVDTPATPTLTGTLAIGYVSSIDAAGDYAYAADFSQLTVISITDLANPAVVGGITTQGFFPHAFISGTTAYICSFHPMFDGSGYLQAISLSNPLSPTVMGTLNMPKGCQTLTAVDQYIYAASSDGLHIILAHNLQEVGRYPISPKNVLISGSSEVSVHIPYVFTATVLPVTTSLPITYVWKSTTHSAVTQVDEVNNAISITWDTPGAKIITVTAENLGGMVTDTYTILVNAVAPTYTAPSVLTYTWQTDFIDDARGIFAETQERAMRLDGAGHPHMVYGGLHLYYAWHDGTAWHIETADNAFGVGSSASLALEATAPYTPHIIYCDDLARLKYATWTGSQWRTQIVDDNWPTWQGCDASIAVNSNGQVNIAYRGGLALRYAQLVNGIWNIQVVDSVYAARQHSPQAVTGGPVMGTGYFHSLALDGSGNPHIVYMDERNNVSLKHAYRTGPTANWIIELVDQNIGYPDDASLVLDTAGRPQIAYSGYFGLPDGQMRYARWTGTTWITQTMFDFRDKSLALALDASNKPRLAFGSYHNWLRYATLSGTTWISEVIETSAAHPALALDTNGIPSIGYIMPSQAGTNANIKYAYLSGTTWVSQSIDYESYVGNYASLALDPLGRLHVSYQYDPSGPYSELRHAYWTGSTWVTETVIGGSYKGSDTSLKIGANGNPVIAYIQWQINVMLANWTGMAWQTNLVASGGTGLWTRPSLALDSSGNPHVLSYSSDVGELVHQWSTFPNPYSWQLDVPAADLGNNAGSSSLQLDAGNVPHVAYYDQSRGTLGYAYRSWAGYFYIWNRQTVDNVGNTGLHPSLVLDVIGRPHISYSSVCPDMGLRYAHLEGGNWVTQTVVPNTCGTSTSLALDSQNRPCISYGMGDVGYICWDGSNWQRATVGWGGSANSVPLVLDSLDHPHLVSYDGNIGGLKYFHLAQASQSVVPGNSASLTYTSTLGSTSTIVIPAGAVTETTDLVYIEASQVGNVPANFAFGNFAFDLKAYRNGNELTNFTFEKPITLTVHYPNSAVTGLAEGTLTLRYWNGSAWASDGISMLNRDPGNNTITFSIAHLSDFAMFGSSYKVFLPLIRR